MSWVDLVIITVCFASAAFGAMRGFAKETLSLITWITAIWMAWNFSWLVAFFLGEWTAAPELKVWAGRAIVFLLVLVAGGMTARLIGTLIKQTGLGGTDRLLGSLFGFGRGAIILGLAALVLELTGLDEDPWWREARLSPYGDRIAQGIRHYAAVGSGYLRDQEMMEEPAPQEITAANSLSSTAAVPRFRSMTPDIRLK